MTRPLKPAMENLDKAGGDESQFRVAPFLQSACYAAGDIFEVDELV